METPIPLALSLLKMADNIANDVKIMDSKTPIKISDAPVFMDEYRKIGIPQPIRNAKINAVERPKKILNQTLLRGTG